MKLRDYFEHYGIDGNPFAEEDAQKDQVFQEHCIETTFHPAWDKLYGKPAKPDSAIIFGEKGAGKTALRFQMINAIKKYNENNPESHPLVIEYANWNPFLDHFRRRFSERKKIENILSRWQLWDHIDAILSLGVTQVVDQILIPNEVRYPAVPSQQEVKTDQLTHHKKRDLLALAAFYDQPKGDDLFIRWKQLAHKLSFSTWKSYFLKNADVLIALVLTILIVTLSMYFGSSAVLGKWWFYLLIVASWSPRLWKMICRYNRAFWVTKRLRVLKPNTPATFRRLMCFERVDYAGIAFPDRRGTDTRYELLSRYLDVLDTLGYSGVVVLIDQVDEPYLISGSPDLMQKVLWPMFDNKLLKYPGVGFKFLLPNDLLRFLERETQEFHQRARIDKQNLIRSLDWTGSSLYDLANDRLQTCCKEGKNLKIDQFFDPAVTRQRLETAFDQLKVPRHLFKFLYRVIMMHVNAHSDGEPVWRIPLARFETELALYLNDRRASERNVGVI